MEFSTSNRHADLMIDNVDCVIRAGPVDELSVMARRIGAFRLLTCASPAYLSAFRTPATPADLGTKHQLLGLISTRTGKPIPLTMLPETSEGPSMYAGACRMLKPAVPAAR